MLGGLAMGGVCVSTVSPGLLTTCLVALLLANPGGLVRAVQVLGNLLELSREQPARSVDVFINFHSLESIPVPAQLDSSPYAGLQEFATDAAVGVADGHDRALSLKGRSAKRQAVYKALHSHAVRTQGPVLSHLRHLGYEAESFWINNSILIREAPAYLINLLVAFSHTAAGADIVSLSADRIVARISPSTVTRGARSRLYAQEESVRTMDLAGSHPDEQRPVVPWNLRLIRAHLAWRHARGEGIVVANIDTGVDHMHPQLMDSYRGHGRKEGDRKDGAPPTGAGHDYSWFDPRKKYLEPTDVQGHGTHTMGTMVGRNVGVAPGARWIAALGCEREGCSQARLLSSAQWVLCPTKRDGSAPRCDLGADVVNNSWGGALSDDLENMTWFSAAVRAWLAADMVPVFAQGNSGPECATAGTPGDLANVIAVGAVDAIGALTFFSSRGPGGSKLGHVQWKPDFVAPGQAVISCEPGGGLVAMSGTSMAAPHVAGAAALLLSRHRDLTFAQLRDLLQQTVDQTSLLEPQEGGQASCSGVRWDHFPNYHYGHGLVDVGTALETLLKQK